ncbi:cytochrome P450 [Apiospora saccharicola]
MLVLDIMGMTVRYGVYGFALFLVFAASYRLLLHPLRRYPGPFLAKVTDAYAGLFAAQKRLHLVVLGLHDTHGSYADAPAPNRLLFNSPSAFKAIYQNDDRITKSFTYELLTRNGVYSVFNTLDRKMHAYKRKIVGHAFSQRSIRSFEPALLSQVDIYLEQLLALSSSQQQQQFVNMTEKLGRLAADIIGQLALGYDLATQTSEENRFLPRSMTLSFFVGNISHHFPAFYRVHTNWVFDYLLYETREKFSRLLEKMVKSRLALDTHAVPDFFSFVADELPPGEAAKTRDSVIWKESLVFLAAGADSVTTAMAAAFFYLSRNPACYARLAEEIRSAFGRGNEIREGSRLAGCRYLRACIDEALRMSPPAPANLWRQQVAEDEPLVIDGRFIPRGTLFGVNLYALGHNAAVFPEPFAFKPERWLPLDDDGTAEAKQDETARKAALEGFSAFSIGPRNCVGKPLAYLETSLVLAKTLWYFDFAAAEGTLGAVGERRRDRGRPGEFETWDVFNSSHDGPYLVFRSRESVSSLKEDLEIRAAATTGGTT